MPATAPITTPTMSATLRELLELLELPPPLAGWEAGSVDVGVCDGELLMMAVDDAAAPPNSVFPTRLVAIALSKKDVVPHPKFIHVPLASTNLNCPQEGFADGLYGRR